MSFCLYFPYGTNLVSIEIKKYKMNTKTQPSILSDLFISNFGDVVNDMFKEERPTLNKSFRPSINFVENETSFELTAEIPGVEKEHVSINIENEILRLSGERKAPEKKSKVHVQESRFGKFERIIQLPKRSNVSQIEAVQKDGVLTVTIPKQQDTLPKTIEIK